MIKNLVIVESPAKAKTIEKFLGADYTVTSSYGHVRDLSEGDISVDVANNFTPKYEVTADKKKLISELKKLSKQAEIIWLATDEDREGEAISWHLVEALDLNPKEVKRIVFHEITKPAIERAISNPRTINKDLVDAQQARRILDRLVGYELSPVLWKKVKPSLSAGRVQSVAVKLIVERERDVNNFNSESSFRTKAKFSGQSGDRTFFADLNHRFKQESDALAFLEKTVDAQFKIRNIEIKPAKKSPAPPFTTSTLQQEASRKLGFSVSKTMTIAQKLYEAGQITYMRTDSVNLSEIAIANAETEIKSQYGDPYSQPRRFTTKSQNAQEAHEAIRPTYIEKHALTEGGDEARLYELIWKRTIASQMADAKLENTNIYITHSNSEREFQASGQVIKFDGFLKVYLESHDDEEDGDSEQGSILPPVTIGEMLNLHDVESRQRFTRPAARYTEAALVKKLEELGIGRPSTYAPTISTIQKRTYVLKETREGKDRNVRILILKNKEIIKKTENESFGAEKNKLFPSDTGILVTDFLDEHFKSVMDYGFTASVEAQFDQIANGKTQWQDMLSGFYKPFHDLVEDTSKNADRANQIRSLGVHPENGENIYARFGKFGPFVQMGESDDETKKPKYAKMRQGQLIETITMEDALELFKMPRELGSFEEKPITVDIGRFGPYVKHDKLFASIPKAVDPYEIDLNSAIELIQAKRISDANKFIKEFTHSGKTIQILNGRWGPYIKVGKDNFKIPKTVNAEELELDEVLTYMKPSETKPKRGAKKK